MNDLHGIIFAYRSDANLGELTRPRNTCSLPFGGRYRLVDFMLSNYVNAGITDVGIIVHQSYQSLLDHVGSGKDWELSRRHGGLRILPPFGYAERGGEYRGNMDALAGVADYLENIRQEYVILAWGDMAVNLPVAEVLQQHIDTGADVTMVCTPTLKGAPRFSEYVEVDEEGRVTDLSVHPVAADKTLESLEVYILSKKLLLDMVDYCAAHDIINFSRGVLQPRLKTLKLMSYVHQGYVARFQSVSGYFERSMDLLAWTCWTPPCGTTCSTPPGPSAPRTAPAPPPTTALTPSPSTPWWPTAASSRARWRTPSSPGTWSSRRAPKCPTAC